MRVDLFKNAKRPLPARAMLAVIRRWLGTDPGPPTVLTYRTSLFRKPFLGYLMRATSGKGVWPKGEAEMFSAFVSRQNSCGF